MAKRKMSKAYTQKRVDTTHIRIRKATIGKIRVCRLIRLQSIQCVFVYPAYTTWLDDIGWRFTVALCRSLMSFIQNALCS